MGVASCIPASQTGLLALGRSVWANTWLGRRVLEAAARNPSTWARFMRKASFRPTVPHSISTRQIERAGQLLRDILHYLLRYLCLSRFLGCTVSSVIRRFNSD